MKKRHIYTILFLVPGLFVSLLVVGAMFAIVAGTLWLYVFGDRTWPAWTDHVIPLVMLVVFFSSWLGITVTGYRVGKKLESSPGLDRRHMWMSLGATLLPVMIVFLHQLSVGNLGPRPDSQVCGEYCSDLGFSTSGVPPRDSGERTCQCLGEFGTVERSVPIDELSRR